MKKLILFFLLLLPFSFVFSQVPRDKVVVEVQTSVNCPWCPSAARGVDDLIENGWPVAAIEYHGLNLGSDPFSNPSSVARETYYGFEGYPNAYFDGILKVLGGNSGSMYQSYLPKVQTRMNTPSPLTITVWGTHTGLNYNLLIRLEKQGTISGSNIRLRASITESNIIYSWEGMTELDYVNRMMVPDANGTQVDLNANPVLDVPLSCSIQSSWVLSNLELTVFVQNNSTKEILQGYKVLLLWLMPPPPPLAAGFSAEDTLVCATHQVQFTDESTGDVIEWYWEFPGGTPDTSREENPLITYNTPGEYDVSLTVSDDYEDNTITKPAYITVLTLPEVSFSAIDDQCVNYPAFELTQGSPAGGTYAGPGVEDNVFHPDLAGAGTHTLTYTYADENSCDNTAEQTVVVDECTGVPDGQEISIYAIPNPTTGLINLSLNNATGLVINLRIINSIGKIVYQQDNVQLNGSHSTGIDLTTFASGIYYIQVEGGKSTYFKKIIVQK